MILYLKNNNSVKHLEKVLLIVILIYLQVFELEMVSLVVLSFYFDLLPPFYFLK